MAEFNEKSAAAISELEKHAEMVREDGKRQLLQLQNKMAAEASRQSREIEKEREKHRQEEQAGHAREQALRLEMQEMRNVLQMKI